MLSSASTSAYAVLLLSSIVSPCLAQNSSTGAVCDKYSITAKMNATLVKEGPICGLSLGTHLDLSPCCAPDQPIYYTDACTQYCRVNKNWTLSGFTECASLAAQDHNLTLGITGCEGGAGRMGKMALEGAVLGAAFVGLVLAF